MIKNILDAVLADIRNYAIGLLIPNDGVGRSVLGSGVLVSINGRMGILTCGHVAERYANLPEIGWLQFSSGSQRGRNVSLADSQTIIGHSGNSWTSHGGDIAFTHLNPEVVSSLEARCVFLNLEKNRAKIEAPEKPEGEYLDVVLGLVEEQSGMPFTQAGTVISPLHGVLFVGRILGQEKGLLTFEVLDDPNHPFPKSFGGMSGAGLWRIYYVQTQDGMKITGRILSGVAAWQIDDQRIACQGWDRIDQGLIPAIHENLKF